MRQFAVVDKKVGETPLAALQAWKKQNLKYADMLACYAGRLDPMASGKLLVLLGDECKRQRVYTKLDKEYEIEVLLFIGSDTGDVLGIPESAGKEIHPDKKILADALYKEQGAYIQTYPAFSSKTVHGKPLFLYALEGTISSVKMPKHIERMYRIRHQSSYMISGFELEAKVSRFLDQVPRTEEPSKQLGEDFRVDTVRAHWKSLFKTAQERNFLVLRLKVTCASGAYMRSLAGRIGTSLGTRALALSIKRTKIGKYIPLFGSMGCWVRTY